MTTKKGKVLVLGAGNSRQHRLIINHKDPGANFEDNFEQVVTIDWDPATKPTYLLDLNSPDWASKVKEAPFDEVHVYEVLEHLGELGNYEMFFSTWKNIWNVLKPFGIACCTTPWWESVWAWSDPGHLRVYTQELLVYLDQDQYAQIGKTAMTDYRRVWPSPYSFKTIYAERYGEDPKSAGFNFILEKRVYEGK